jgi:hypothetical protein
LNVPAVGNVRDAVPLLCSVTFAGEFAVVNVTLCSAWNVQVTEPFRATGTCGGLNWLPDVAVTEAVADGAPTVTLTVAVLVTEPIVPVAVMVVVPNATPVMTPPGVVTLAVPGAFDT